MHDANSQDKLKGPSSSVETINGIKFTPREIDVLGCVLGGRSGKKIATFLSISSKTVQNHIHHIMLKLECNSRESIKDFLENASESSFLKNRYLELVFQSHFEKKLKEISVQNPQERTHCLVIYEGEDENKNVFFSQFEKHLELAGVRVTLESRNNSWTFDDLKQELENSSKDRRIFLVPQTLMKTLQLDKNVDQVNVAPHIEDEETRQKIFLLLLPINREKVLIRMPEGDLKEQETQKNYYFFLIEILKRLFPKYNFTSLISYIEGHYEEKRETFSSKQFNFPLFHQQTNIFKDNVLQGIRNKKWLLPLLAYITILGLVYYGVAFIQQANTPGRQQESFIRFDLIIPTAEVLLERPQIITTIEEKLKGQAIQVVALIGPGGSGKTTLARLYALSQRAPLIWEINAETHEGLVRSFEDLAYVLSKTDADKKILKELQDIMDPEKKENRLLSFIKEKLKGFSGWFLIYDNVENFPDIQNYFPRDGGTWGQGKVILTTRNRNIQNNKHVNSAVFIEQLDDQQKLDLFSKIMDNDNKTSISPTRVEENKEFLKAIPSFPLDVSVAAYYIKSTNIPYKDYLEILENPSQRFIDVQTDILKDTSDYIKTRYGIITLSLQRLLSIDKDFIDLLLLMSLLDSQNIPRELLEKQKDKSVVDSFIYNLKKYSLISGSFSPATAAFSIHRSTQAISLAYLTQKLKLTESSSHIQSTSDALKQYMNDVRDKKNYRELEILIAHCKAFLSHHLLTNDDKGVISRYLGHIYTYLGQHIRAKKILEESLSALQQSKSKNYIEIFQTTAFVANADREIGQYEQAKDLLEQNLSLYQHHLPEKHWGLPQAFLILGTIYWELGQYEKAKHFLEKSLVLYEKYHFDMPLKAPWVLIHLGTVERQLGNYKKAKLLLEKGLAGYQNNLPENHLYLVGPLLFLGNLYEDIGEYDKAKDLLEQCQRIQANEHSENQVYAAWIGGHLGNIYRKLGEYEKARAILKESLSLYQKHLPENKRYINWILVNLGDAYKDSGNYKKAKELLEKSLVAYEKHFGKNHLEAARILNSLGQVCLYEGNIEASGTLLNKAAAIFEQNKHPDIYMVFEGLAQLYQKKSEQANKAGLAAQAQNFKDQAHQSLKQALEIVKTHFPEGSPHVRRIQSKIDKLKESHIPVESNR